MNLIDEKVIEEAAKEYVEKERAFDDNYCAFTYGFNQALNELQPLIVEFAEWSNHHYERYTIYRNQDNTWVKKLDYNNNQTEFTTQQLLEEFINSKTK